MALLSLGRNLMLEQGIGNVAAPGVDAAETGAVVAATKDAGETQARGGSEALAAVDAAATTAGDQATSLALATGEKAVAAANEKLADARKGITDSLAPWIPGDFLVAYGTLLTAWTALRADFKWMLGLTIVFAFLFVFLGAAAQAGWGKLTGLKGKLTLRAIIGAAVSAFASFAVPNSGWYDFDWMAKNETSVVLTAGVVVTVLVLFLKGLPKALGGTT